MKALIYFVAMEKSQKFEETEPGEVVESMVDAYDFMAAERDRLAAAKIKKLVAQKKLDSKKDGILDYMKENKTQFPNETARKLYVLEQTVDERHELDKRESQLIMAEKNFQNAKDEISLMRDLIQLGWKYDENGPSPSGFDIDEDEQCR
ncbi:MAG: hypothetical protein WC489_07125 [Patescibacteria group bacterium]|jgi:hypothetical protein